MALVMLKHTSNVKYQYLVGRVGELKLLSDGRFAFEFTDLDGSTKTLASGIKARLGELDDIRSPEVNIITNHSTYDFEKLENYIEDSKVFGHLSSSVDDKIASASMLASPDFSDERPSYSRFNER